jgi:adenine phosphoribosyltransferase
MQTKKHGNRSLKAAVAKNKREQNFSYTNTSKKSTRTSGSMSKKITSPVQTSDALQKKLKLFSKRFERKIRTVPDFPKQGIMFKDITTVLKEKKLFSETVDMLASLYKSKRIDKVVSIESRGFIFGAALAYKLGAGFVPVRKPNKLPAEKIREEYVLEYGTDALEIHTDAIRKGERVLVHDDLLATGGTAGAACRLVERVGGKVVGLCFLIELTFLNGREKLNDYDVVSLLKV